MTTEELAELILDRINWGETVVTSEHSSSKADDRKIHGEFQEARDALDEIVRRTRRWWKK